MAHHRLGHREQGRRCFDRAIAWLTHPGALSGEQAKDLTAFRAEAESVLAGPAGELPDDVFAGSASGMKGEASMPNGRLIGR